MSVYKFLGCSGTLTFAVAHRKNMNIFLFKRHNQLLKHAPKTALLGLNVVVFNIYEIIQEALLVLDRPCYTCRYTNIDMRFSLHRLGMF